MLFSARTCSLTIIVYCLRVSVVLTEVNNHMEQASQKDGREPEKSSIPPPDRAKEIVRRAELMKNLKYRLKKTENLLGNMFGSSSVMYSSRDKDDSAIETIHSSVNDYQKNSNESRNNGSVADAMYETAVIYLKSYSENKHIVAFELLATAGKLGHKQSRLQIAWATLMGDYKQDLNEAKNVFIELAAFGEPDAHMALGFIYSIGITEQSNQAKALVHYMLGALGGNIWAQIVLGYRYKNGVTVAANCEKALQFYELAANSVVKHVSLSGGPVVHRVRLIELEENGHHSSYWLEPDLLQYYEYLASKGDLNSQITLGQLYYHGMRGCPKDIRKALYFFKLAVKKGSSTAMGYLGRIYLEDVDSKVNVSSALNYFKLAAEKNNPIGLTGLGLLYLEGRGVELDLAKAKWYFGKAADIGWMEGQVQLAIMHMNGLGTVKDYRSAFKYFHLAAQSGHILAYYYLAQMHATGLGIRRSCPAAVELYKSVGERGKWNEYFMSGSTKYHYGQHLKAFLVYSLLAEMGYEVAQTNAAYMLENGLSGLPNITEEEKYFRAFNYWRRAAQQGYSLAYVKMGDYYYYGRGVPVDYESAANQYRLASNLYGNAQALFNIGYMHERGLGIPRDLALAKRFYDLAATVSPDAYVPVYVALLKLVVTIVLDYLRSQVFHGTYENFIKRMFVDPWDLYATGFLCIALWTLIYRRAV